MVHLLQKLISSILGRGAPLIMSIILTLETWAQRHKVTTSRKENILKRDRDKLLYDKVEQFIKIILPIQNIEGESNLLLDNIRISTLQVQLLTSRDDKIFLTDSIFFKVKKQFSHFWLSKEIGWERNIFIKNFTFIKKKKIKQYCNTQKIATIKC